MITFCILVVFISWLVSPYGRKYVARSAQDKALKKEQKFAEYKLHGPGRVERAISDPLRAYLISHPVYDPGLACCCHHCHECRARAVRENCYYCRTNCPCPYDHP